METEIMYKGRKATLVTSNFQAPQIRISNFQYVVLPDVNFDADFEPNHPINIKDASQRGLRYDLDKGYYVDEDDCLVRDNFGQHLG